MKLHHVVLECAKIGRTLHSVVVGLCLCYLYQVSFHLGNCYWCLGGEDYVLTISYSPVVLLLFLSRCLLSPVHCQSWWVSFNLPNLRSCFSVRSFSDPDVSLCISFLHLTHACFLGLSCFGHSILLSLTFIPV